MSGRNSIYNIDDISLVDINALIDKGPRFTIVSGNEEECDSVEEDLKDV